jgi:restriction system protein
MAKRSAMSQIMKSIEASSRQAEQARAREQRQREQAARQAERQRAQQAKQAAAADKAAYQLQRAQEAVEQTEDLQRQIDGITSILATGLKADSFVDLRRFLAKPDYPRFPRPDLRSPIPQPEPITPPPEPVYEAPKGPSLFGKKKHAAVVAAAEAAHVEDIDEWKLAVARVPTAQMKQIVAHQEQEEARLAELAAVEARHSALCSQIDTEIEESNAEVMEAIAGLERGDESAVTNFMALVLVYSPYPDDFPVVTSVTYDALGKELTVMAGVPLPETLPVEKEFKYNKSKDEITSSSQTQKALKDLYLAAVIQVALRVLHDVFEADRQGNIEAVSLTVSTEGIDPATGIHSVTPLVVGAVARPVFEELELQNIEPLATLDYLNVLVSKNPYGRVAVNASRGVRGAKG